MSDWCPKCGNHMMDIVCDHCSRDFNDALEQENRQQYPESLVRRNEQLEKALEIHKLELQRLEDYNQQLRYDMSTLKQLLVPDENTGETVWHWQHDGYDNISSMHNGQAILISVEDLRELIENGEIVYESI